MEVPSCHPFAIRGVSYIFGKSATPNKPDTELFGILFLGILDGSNCVHRNSVYAVFKSTHQFWTRPEYTRTKMPPCSNQVVAEYDDSQKHEIVLLGRPGQIINTPVSYSGGFRITAVLTDGYNTFFGPS
jgi:hypothetical protein